jgi:hypothetical protein
MDLKEIGCEIEHWAETVACYSENADKLNDSIKSTNILNS